MLPAGITVLVLLAVLVIGYWRFTTIVRLCARDSGEALDKANEALRLIQRKG